MTEKIDSVIGGGGGSFDGDVVFGTWTPTLGVAPANFSGAGNGASLSPDGYSFSTGSTGGWLVGADQPFDTTLRGQGFIMGAMPVGDTSDSIGFGITTFTVAGLDPSPPTGGGLVIILSNYDSTLQQFDGIQFANPFVGDFYNVVATPTIVQGDKLFFGVVDNGDGSADISLYVNGSLIETGTIGFPVSTLPTAPMNYSFISLSTFNWTGDLITNPIDVPVGVTQYQVTGGINNYPAGRENKIFEITGLGVSTVETDDGLLLFDELLVLFNAAGNIADIPKMGQHLTQAEANQLYQPKYNTVENPGAPTINDDIGAGYNVFDYWIDTSVSPREVYVCTNNSPGAAVWENTTFNTGDVGSMAFQNTANYYQKTETYSQSEVNALVAAAGGVVSESKSDSFSMENGKVYSWRPVGAGNKTATIPAMSSAPFWAQITLNFDNSTIGTIYNLQTTSGGTNTNFYIGGESTGSGSYSMEPGATYIVFYDGFYYNLIPLTTVSANVVTGASFTMRDTENTPVVTYNGVGAASGILAGHNGVSTNKPRVGHRCIIQNNGGGTITLSVDGGGTVSPATVGAGEAREYIYSNVNGSTSRWTSFGNIGGGA